MALQMTRRRLFIAKVLALVIFLVVMTAWGEVWGWTLTILPPWLKAAIIPFVVGLAVGNWVGLREGRAEAHMPSRDEYDSGS